MHPTSHPDIRPVALSAITVDKRAQPRTVENQEVIADYIAAMLHGDVFPPLVVFNEGQAYWLADGFHRLHAALGCKRAEILCDVRPGTLRDAVLFSAGANAEHGQRRSADDKRRAVRRLLEDPEWSEWSDNHIRKHCRVSFDLVQRMRSSLTSRSRSDEPAPAGKASAVPPAVASKADRIEQSGGTARFFNDRHGNVSVMNTAAIGRREITAASLPRGRCKRNEQPVEAAPRVPAGRPASAEEQKHRVPARPAIANSAPDDGLRAYMSQGDPEIYDALFEIDRLIGALPGPEVAARDYPDRLRHRFTREHLQSLSQWMARFAAAWTEAGEAFHVAAE